MLKAYKEKRDFTVTPEPAADQVQVDAGPLTFVIQKHAATRLHYDLRLEVDGVLWSWAVPKGPSLDPAEKRMAVHVEDHPLSYATFEGQIPKGEYGGGEVIVWDRGVYTPDDKGLLSWDDREAAERRMREDYAKGKLSFTLRGHKLQGSWTLIKVKSKGKEDAWLLIKHQDAHASTRDVLLEDRSVLTGRTIEDVAAGRSGRESQSEQISQIKGVKKAAMPKQLTPMAATEVQKPFNNDAWHFEVKLDGIRLLALVDEGKVKLLSRNGNDATRKFPRLVEELAAMPHERFILDGEVVTYDDQGIPSFQGLMERYQRTNEQELRKFDTIAPIEFCVFDLLYLDGWDLRGAALRDRRALLEASALRGQLTRLVDAFQGEGELVFEHAREHGFEGVVGKRLDSKYQDGVRSAHWVKIKGYHTEEFVIGGFLEGQNTRSRTFGSLVLGQYVDGKLIYQGNVGGGFTDPLLEMIRKQLDKLVTKENPFGAPIPGLKGKITFVEPKLVAEVRFMTRTREGRLRFPIFIRLRPDVTDSKAAAQPVEFVEVVEAAAAPPPTKDMAADVLDQLEGATGDSLQLDIDGYKIKLSSLKKILWPAQGEQAPVTKRDLLIYYAKMGDTILPHLKDRPVAIVRFPEGIKGERFFQKHWEHGVPEYIETVNIYSSSNDRSSEYTMVNNLPTLLYLAQMSALEIHPWYSRIDPAGDAEGLPTKFDESEENLDASVLSYPDFLVVDLDPNIRSGSEKAGDEPELNRKAWEMCVEAAHGTKTLLDAMGLKGFLKTSGKTGLHVYIPIRRDLEYGVVRTLAEQMGRHLLKEMPKQLTMEWVVKNRPEKVFWDHNQNVRGKTLISIYSPRPVPGAPVSMPIDWKDLDKVYPTDFHLFNVPALIAKKGDRWADILESKQDLRAMLGV